MKGITSHSMNLWCTTMLYSTYIQIYIVLAAASTCTCTYAYTYSVLDASQVPQFTACTCILMAHGSLSSLAYPMITHTLPLVVSNLLIHVHVHVKTWAAKQMPILFYSKRYDLHPSVNETL